MPALPPTRAIAGGERPKRKLTPRSERALELLANGATTAVAAAGAKLTQRRVQLLVKSEAGQRRLLELARQRTVGLVPRALTTLERVMEGSRNDHARVAASRLVLERALPNDPDLHRWEAGDLTVVIDLRDHDGHGEVIRCGTGPAIEGGVSWAEREDEEPIL
jgi:hypothetical protein